MTSIEKLKALLALDEQGEELASIINEFLIDPSKRDVLLIRLQEIRKEMSTLKSDIKLAKSEQAVRSLVLGSKKPLTAQEIASLMSEEYRSLKHTSHASSVANALVEKGILGKFKFGHNAYFTSPLEAVRQSLKRRDEMPDECSPAEIASEIGMPLAVVLDAIGELLG